MCKSSDSVSKLADALYSGKVCVFETDTVIGIACSVFPFNKNLTLEESIKTGHASYEKIYQIKNRDKSKQLPWMLYDENDLNTWIHKKDFFNTKHFNNTLSDLINTGWPGATTLIFDVNEKVPDYCCSTSKNKKTVAFRVPKFKELCEAIKLCGSPIFCTSANISGQLPVSDINYAPHEVLNEVDFVFTKHCTTKQSNKPSKIIDCTNSDFRQLR